jgi:hypothetical protein
MNKVIIIIVIGALAYWYYTSSTKPCACTEQKPAV